MTDGNSAALLDLPSALEKVALAEIRPRNLQDMPDDELRLAWLRLNQWFHNLKATGSAVEDVVNAALWAMDEMKRRGWDIDESELTAAVNEWSKTVKMAQYRQKFGAMPKELVVVENFVSCAGSTAKGGKSPPRDLDMVIRASSHDGELRIGTQNVWLPIRNAFDPEKEDRLSFICNPQGSHGDHIPLYDLVLRRRDEIATKVVKNIAKALKPFQAFTPPKPAMAGFTEFFDIDELWKWAEPKLPVAVEPKYNGFRGILEGSGTDIKLWFEGSPDINRALTLPGVKEAGLLVGKPFVLDVDVAIVRSGKRLPRPELMRLNSEDPKFADNERVVMTVFDVPFYEGDLTGEPFEKRREVLEALFEGKLKESPYFDISSIRWANSKEALSRAAQWAFGFDRSEGLVAKAASSLYETESGSISDWAKLKRIAEIKVIVLGKETKEDGAVYRGGLSDVGDWTNTAEFEGKAYVDLGNTLITKLSAQPGDILTVQILELVPSEKDGEKTLTWVSPRVVDVDDSRKTPYSVGQAIDIAQRASILQKSAAIPPHIPRNPKVAFVGASPSPIEGARRELLTGPTAEIFKKQYLHPMGISPDECAIINAVPIVLKHEDGRARVPTQDEMASWAHNLASEIDALRPAVIIALGHIAKSALHEPQFVLPHPETIRRFGDKRGELSRKIKQVAAYLAKQDEGGETRAEAAGANWEKNWHEMMPSNGSGRFVYQHHFRGLTEEQSKMSNDELMGTNNSLHGDLRFEGDDGAWGFAVLVGDASDNRDLKFKDKLLSLEDLRKLEKLQIAPKLQQPKEWLSVGVSSPKIEPPGGVGSTKNTWSKFFAIDHGTYKLGVVRQHAVEVFLDGAHLKGRYLMQFAPVGGRRIWLIDKPENQTPTAESENLDDTLRELRQKHQPYLIWGKPGERPKKYSTESGQVVKSVNVPILKADEDKRIVYGVVLDPYQIDAHGDYISPAEIEQTAHDWMRNSRVVSLDHRGPANAEAVESWVEQYPTQADYRRAIKGEPHKVWRRQFGGDVLHSGAWVLGTRLDEDLWQAYKNGELAAYSIEGFAVREPLKIKDAPAVKFVDLVEVERSADWEQPLISSKS